MQVSISAPIDHVDITLRGVTLDDISGLLAVLEPDRNNDARRKLYEELRRARHLIREDEVA